MIYFIDKFFLRFFGYEGPYLNNKMNFATKQIENYDNILADNSTDDRPSVLANS